MTRYGNSDMWPFSIRNVVPLITTHHVHQNLRHTEK
jgi:hypothetical protein